MNARRVAKGKAPFNRAQTAMLYLMLAKGILSFKELAKLSGIVTVGRALRGDHKVNAGTVAALSMALQVPPFMVEQVFAQVEPSADLEVGDGESDEP